MEERQVSYQVQGPAALLTIDREKARNALSPQVIAELNEALSQAEADPAVRVVALTGAGSKVFSAGGDLGGMQNEGGFLGTHEGRRGYGELLKRLSRFPRPTIARLNGHALAGGFGLVLACDLAIAAEEAQLGLPEIDVGLFPMMVMALLQRHVGRKRALELVMTGDKISAKEGLALGLLSRVVPASELDSAVAGLTEKLAGKSRAVLTLGKRAFHTAEDLPFDQAIEHLASQLSLNVLAEDAAEGVTAFMEKRKPRWADR
ncbi:MAG: enoyl-CoA hydratase/isomerase family protein [Myxococcaceae bacterium]